MSRVAGSIHRVFKCDWLESNNSQIKHFSSIFHGVASVTFFYFDFGNSWTWKPGKVMNCIHSNCHLMTPLMHNKLTARPLLCNCDIQICSTGLLSKVTLGQILYSIWCTNRSTKIATSRANTQGFVAHCSATDVVRSTAASGFARIFKIWTGKICLAPELQIK